MDTIIVRALVEEVRSAGKDIVGLLRNMVASINRKRMNVAKGRVFHSDNEYLATMSKYDAATEYLDDLIESVRHGG